MFSLHDVDEHQYCIHQGMLPIYHSGMTVRTTKVVGYRHNPASVQRYIVTIDTNPSECILGEQDFGGMQLNLEGEIIRLCWVHISQYLPGISLDAFTLLPTKLCGIVSLGRGYKQKDLEFALEQFMESATRQIQNMRDTDACVIWGTRPVFTQIQTEEELQRLRYAVLSNELGEY